MPIVTIKVAGALSREQKRDIAAEVTDTLERLAGKEKKWTYVCFEEVALEDWAVAGTLLDEVDE